MSGKLHDLVLLNIELGEAEKNGNQKTLKRILSANLLFRRASGVIVDLSTYLAELSNMSYSLLQSGEFEVDEKPESALVTLVVSAAGTRQDPSTGTATPFAGRYRNARLFVKEEGAWRCTVWLNVRIGDLPMAPETR